MQELGRLALEWSNGYRVVRSAIVVKGSEVNWHIRKVSELVHLQSHHHFAAGRSPG